jgi:hypothetical protein
MKTYHPPMTALEAEMEEELAREAHQPNEAMAMARQLREEAEEKTEHFQTEGEMDRETEAAMHLDA